MIICLVKHMIPMVTAGSGTLTGKNQERQEPSQQNLLCGISRTVQAEASAVFYGPKNHFVLPCRMYDYPKTSGHVFHGSDIPKIPPFYSVSYTFDMRDLHLDPWEMTETIKNKHRPAIKKYALSHSKREIQADMQERIHSLARFRLVLLWEQRCEIMCDQLAATFLQIDLEECYCPLGCCRMVESLCGYIGTFEAFPKQMEIIGLEDEEEAQEARKAINYLNFLEDIEGDSRIVCKDAQGHLL